MAMKFLDHFGEYKIEINSIYRIYPDLDNIKCNNFIVISNIVYFISFDRE